MNIKTKALLVVSVVTVVAGVFWQLYCRLACFQERAARESYDEGEVPASPPPAYSESTALAGGLPPNYSDGTFLPQQNAAQRADRYQDQRSVISASARVSIMPALGSS